MWKHLSRTLGNRKGFLQFLAAAIPKVLGVAKTIGSVASTASGIAGALKGGGSGGGSAAPAAGTGMAPMAGGAPMSINDPAGSVKGISYGDIIAKLLSRRGA